jgi:maltose alpha-D-glucosyltransferase/alpha-amylase
VFRRVLDRKVEVMRIRCHGDYHLGQVLYTGRDFVIIDFEGEPLRPLSERRIKRTALVDVAGMIRSFHYAAYHSVFADQSIVRPEDQATMEPWIRYWYAWVAASFLRSYLHVARGAPFLPAEPEALEALLTATLLEKALYEVRYEANNRPGWVKIPIQGIVQLLDAAR